MSAGYLWRAAVEPGGTAAGLSDVPPALRVEPADVSFNSLDLLRRAKVEEAALSPAPGQLACSAQAEARGPRAFRSVRERHGDRTSRSAGLVEAIDAAYQEENHEEHAQAQAEAEAEAEASGTACPACAADSASPPLLQPHRRQRLRQAHRRRLPREEKRDLARGRGQEPHPHGAPGAAKGEGQEGKLGPRSSGAAAD